MSHQTVIDYAFIPGLTSTSRISTEIQKIQNKMLKTIKFFPIKTTTKSIHNFFKMENGDERWNQLFKNFTSHKESDKLISQEIEKYLSNKKANNTTRFDTPFDLFISHSKIFI